MNYIKITKNDIANGEGVRVTLWLSGCSHNCKGCHNPQTHNPNNGMLFDEKAKNEIFQELDKSYISGITFSGGDPLNNNNLQDVLSLIEEIKQTLPDKTIWLYTGYTWGQIMKYEFGSEYIKEGNVGYWNCDALRQIIVLKCNILVDGRYEESQKDITLKWRGSSNQRVIDVEKSVQQKKVVLYEI